MSDYKVEGNILIVNGQRVSFQYKIDNVKLCMGLYIVLLDIPMGVSFLNNIYAVDDNGNIVWQVQDPREVYPINGHIEYVGTRITDDDKIVATNFSGISYTVDPSNGKIIDKGFTK